MGGACADRLRYEENVKEGAFNHAPAVDFVRRAAMAADQGKIKLGVICHGKIFITLVSFFLEVVSKACLKLSLLPKNPFGDTEAK